MDLLPPGVPTPGAVIWGNSNIFRSIWYFAIKIRMQVLNAGRIILRKRFLETNLVGPELGKIAYHRKQLNFLMECGR